MCRVSVRRRPEEVSIRVGAGLITIVLLVAPLWAPFAREEGEAAGPEIGYNPRPDFVAFDLAQRLNMRWNGEDRPCSSIGWLLGRGGAGPGSGAQR